MGRFYATYLLLICIVSMGGVADQKSPAVIPVDIGRQLFVGDFLVYHTSMTRQYHTLEWRQWRPQ